MQLHVDLAVSKRLQHVVHLVGHVQHHPAVLGELGAAAPGQSLG